MNIRTQCVRFDAAPGDPWSPSATPIYQTATFDQESACELGEYDYSRSGNPTRSVLQSQMAALEGGGQAFAFASGLAALTAVLRFLRPNDRLLADIDLYGGTSRLFTNSLEPFGVTVDYADLTSLRATKRALAAMPRMVFCESLSNPLLRACDLRRLAGLTHAADALLVVDATAVSPYWQRPLDLGADAVVHSATKYLCGHSDVSAGVVTTRHEALARHVGFVQNAEGAALAPSDSFLLLRGMKTLAVRLDHQARTAGKIARWLSRELGPGRVLYPGLVGHPTRLKHRRQSSGSGAVISFFAGDPERAWRLVESLRQFSIAVSFGSVHSVASVPGRMSHASVPTAVRRARSFPEDLVRLSIGLEHERDLMDDLDQALVKAGVPRQDRGPRDESASGSPAPRIRRLPKVAPLVGASLGITRQGGES